MQHRLPRHAICRRVLPLAAAMMLVAGTAAATQQGNTAILYWKLMDNCAKQAQAAFPDFTADSNAKRDASLKLCLEGSNLPPRQPGMPAQSR
jgi:hypothetical protein